MEPKRSDQILDEWSSVARSAMPPGAPSAASTTRVAGPGISLAGGAVLVVAAVAVFALLGNRAGPSGPGAPVPSATPTPAPSIAVAVPMASPTPAPSPSPSATPTPTPSPTATPSPSLLADCNPADLAARITMWEGAAGSRIGHVQLTNNGSVTCSTPDTWQPTLVDGQGRALIEGRPSSTATRIILQAHETVTTLALVSNYCGPTPVAPVSLAFVLDGTTLTADPESATDTTTPPCNGPGQPGSIEMQPWGS
jgi:hypothetical protein